MKRLDLIKVRLAAWSGCVACGTPMAEFDDMRTDLTWAVRVAEAGTRFLDLHDNIMLWVPTADHDANARVIQDADKKVTEAIHDLRAVLEEEEGGDVV